MGVPMWGLGVPMWGGSAPSPPSHLPKSTLHRIGSMGQSFSMGQIWGAGWGSFGVWGPLFWEDGVLVWGSLLGGGGLDMGVPMWGPLYVGLPTATHLPKLSPHPIGSMGQSSSIGQIWGAGGGLLGSGGPCVCVGGVLIRGSRCGVWGSPPSPPSHLPKSTMHPIGSMGQSSSIAQIWGWGSSGVPGGVPIWGGS